MEKDKDFVKFALLMNQVNEAMANADPPSPEKIELYFEVLRDLSLATIRSNAIEFLRNNKSNRGFFPSPAYFRDPRDPETARIEDEGKAMAAFGKIQTYLDHIYDPNFHLACMTTIQRQMERKGEMHLFPLLQRWGTEILSAPTQVVRAQFVKAFVAEQHLEKNNAPALPARDGDGAEKLGEAIKRISGLPKKGEK